MGIAVGIDLGTSNSCVAVVQNNRARVLEDAAGRRIQPSILSFLPDGTMAAGHAAKDRRLTDPENTIFSAKRLIGRNLSSDETKRILKELPYKVAAGPDGVPLVSVRGRQISLPEISALLLRHLKHMCFDTLNLEINQAVITVPANFDDVQRSSTKVAGRIAGFEVLRIINEPTAAALAYGFGGERAERIAVYDFGGGTFDITIVELSGDIFEVLSTAGDTCLGGDDFDKVVMGEMLHEFRKVHKIDLSEDASAVQRLRTVAERVKCQLSTLSNVQATLQNIAVGPKGNKLDFFFKLTRARFEELVRPLIERSFEVCTEALKLAGMKATDLHNVVMVGGTTRVPLVRKRAAEMFSVVPRTEINPDEVVAIGAAIQAFSLTGEQLPEVLPPKPKPKPQAPRTTVPAKASAESFELDVQRKSKPADAPLGLDVKRKAPRPDEPLGLDVKRKAPRPDEPLSLDGKHKAPPSDEPLGLDVKHKAPPTDEPLGLDVKRKAPQAGRPLSLDVNKKGPTVDEPLGLDVKQTPRLTGQPSLPAAKQKSLLLDEPLGLDVKRPALKSPVTRPAIPAKQTAAIHSPRTLELDVKPPSLDLDVKPPSLDLDVKPPSLDLDVKPPSLELDVKPAFPAFMTDPDFVQRDTLPEGSEPPIHASFQVVSEPPVMPFISQEASSLAQEASSLPQPIEKETAFEIPIFEDEVGAVPGFEHVLRDTAPGQSDSPSSVEVTDAARARGALLLDVTPRALGVAVAGGYCDIVIDRNAAIPVEQSRLFSTSTDNQTEVSINIYQGESRRIEDNTKLGHILLSRLRPAPRGVIKIRVTFEIDTDGILGVSARNEESKEAESTKIILAGGLDEDKVKALVQQYSSK